MDIIVLIFGVYFQEVVLLQDSEDSTKFYPRFNLEQTSSFKDLDDGRYMNILGMNTFYELRRSGSV